MAVAAKQKKSGSPTAATDTIINQRQEIIKLWHDSWEGESWTAAWSKAVAGLTPEQAACKPGNGQCHSIWENVNHVIFWRNVTLDKLAGKSQPTEAEMTAHNFEGPATKSAANAEAWKKTCSALKDSHEKVEKAMADPELAFDRIKYHYGHDLYHLGQIMLSRGLQGLPTVL